MDDLTKYTYDKNCRVVREATASASAPNPGLSEMIDYFNSDGASDQVKGLMMNRFAYGVVDDPNSTAREQGYNESPKTYKRGVISAQIDSGQFEVVNTRFGPKIAQTLANLFNADNAKWVFSDEEIEQLLSKHRQDGNFHNALQSADYSSTAVESGVVRIGWEGNHLQYTYVKPSDMTFCYPSLVSEGDHSRTPNRGSIEDCSAVVVKVSDGDRGAGIYVAYIGRSDEYENGRMVTFEGKSATAIPSIGDTNVLNDYTIDGDVANPLTYMQNKDGFEDVPEYPFVLLRGGYMPLSPDLCPITYELYNLSREIELGWSRVLKDSLSAGAGIRAVTNEQTGMPLPEALEGQVVLNRGQSLTVHHGGDVSNALASVESLIRNGATGYSVPARIVMDQSGSQPASGLALIVETEPLNDAREYRISLNRGEIKKIPTIERALIGFHSGRELDYEASFTFGSLGVPRTEEERIAAIKARRELGLSDFVQDIQDYYDLTPEEAKERIGTMRERAVEFPATNKSVTIPTLAGRPERVI
jgi:hypothetical protein